MRFHYLCNVSTRTRCEQGNSFHRHKQTWTRNLVTSILFSFAHKRASSKYQRASACKNSCGAIACETDDLNGGQTVLYLSHGQSYFGHLLIPGGRIQNNTPIGNSIFGLAGEAAGCLARECFLYPRRSSLCCLRYLPWRQPYLAEVNDEVLVSCI
jgi:hypothetical protein